MITEEQRRALFALREALRLCDEAYLMLALNDDGPGMTIETIGPGMTIETIGPFVVLAEVGVYLGQGDISDILEAHPDV